MPVATAERPAPSRSTSTSTSVSLVLRFTVALRISNPWQYPSVARLLSGVAGIRHLGQPNCIARRTSLHVLASEGLTRMSHNEIPSWHGTTILTVRKGGTVVMGGDGQVSIGQTIVKSNAKKVRKLGKGDVIGGFGATADAFTLFERLESKLEQYPG